MKRDPAPIAMWAAIVESRRSLWIHHWTVASTRREARAKYLHMWAPEYHAQALRKVRFARVVVSISEGEASNG